jgi:DNA-binding PadR family transcriptional regulator
LADQNVLKDIQKNTVRNLLDIVVMVKLRQGKPMNGHEMKHYVQKKYNVTISPGTVYDLLYSLDRKGLLKVSAIAGKRMYKLTDEGIDYINCILEMKGDIIRFVDALIS